ncbi:AraC family transcriptional regulator [Flammeovirga sp. SubArs3]|uniref:helix-turn-helix domain-containing protein n=1 Tax=Flammeovirga sp. SubArs3 TaxID=2995316 RepID=UPI00248BC6D3|nr:AraC family transcriptional regulator [Flammeovirga sp. SubArs3]
MQTLLAIGLFQTLLSIFLIFDLGSFKINKSPMMLMLILLAIHFSIKSYILLILKDEYMFQYYATCFTFAYGPLILDFLKMLYNKKRLSKLHFIPLFIGFTIYLYIGVMSIIYKEIIYLDYYFQYISWVMVPSILGYFGYIFLWLVQLKKYPNAFVKWMIPLSAILILIITTAFFKIIPIPYLRTFTYITFLLIAIQYLRYELSLKESVSLWKKNQKIESSPEVIIKEEHTIEGSKKYERSSLSKDQAEAIVKRITQFVERNRLYLNHELSLSDLAEQSKTPKHHLSEALNIHLEKNFYQFINEYRIQEAIRLIEEDPSRKLLHLAFECGFNTKATFNTYFKKTTGNTPSQFKSNHKENSLNV